MRSIVALAIVLTVSACSKPAPTPQPEQATPSDVASAAPAPPPLVPGCPPLTAKEAEKFIALSLDCVGKEYPNKPSNILDGDETVLPPRKLTPAFFGCFDWHSAVHGHWAMVRVLRHFPDIAVADKLRQALDLHLTSDRLRQEVLYFALNRNRTFERPYGWGWLLRLHAELATWDDPDGQRWGQEVGKLSRLLSRRLEEYLASLSVPVRSGTHGNTAFSLVHALDAARTTGDSRLERTIAEAARRFYGDDVNCPTDYEPSGEDFISPCLAEAELMARVLPTKEFATWLTAFLPAPRSDAFARLAQPPEVRDRHDPKIGHLIGLMFQRAWAARAIAAHLPADHPLTGVLTALADGHCRRGVDLMFDSGYGGSHWLASFALYLRTADTD